MNRMQIELDADNVVGGAFTALEREQLPFAIVQACNATAWDVREAWKQEAGRVFDRPRPFTTNAIQYTKARKGQLYAEVYVRDEALAGTPPARYLAPNVDGGTRRKKPFEILLQQAGAMPPGMFAVPGSGAQLDAFGNMPARQIQQILSQVRARRDPLANETAASRARRRNRESKRIGRRDYFAVTKKEGGLTPGIYEHLTLRMGDALRKILHYVRGTNYKARYDIFGYAERTWHKLMPFHFRRELDKAVKSSEQWRGQ